MFFKTKNKKDKHNQKRTLKKVLKVRGLFVFLKNITQKESKNAKNKKRNEFISKRKDSIRAFHKSGNNQIYLKQTLEDYFDFSSINKKKLGKEY